MRSGRETLRASPLPRFDLMISAKRRDAEHAEKSAEFHPDFRS